MLALRYAFASLLVAVTLAAPAWGQTHVSGNITVDTTWDMAGSPWIVDAHVYVFEGARLTIEPGVEVRFANSVDLYIGRNVNGDASDKGALSADGTIADPITFTKNTTYRGGAIVFDGRGAPPMISDLRHCDVNSMGRGQTGAVMLLGHSAVTIENCAVNGSETRGIFCDAASRPTIATNTVTNCLSEPVRIAAENVDALSGNTYGGNSPDAVTVYGDVTRSLTWPHEGIPYYADGSITIWNGATLTLAPSVTVAFPTNTFLFVGRSSALNESDRGALYAVGSPGNMVSFVVRSGGNWGGIFFEGTGYAPLPSTLDYCAVVDAGGDAGGSCVYFRSHSNVTMTNSAIRHSESYGVFCDDNSAPTLTGNEMSNNTSYPLRIGIDNPPVLAGNTYHTNGRDMIRVDGDVVIDATLPNDGVPYDRTAGDIDIYDGATLTLSPGITLLLDNNNRINVGWDPGAAASSSGALIADGTDALPITVTKRATYEWGSIRFDGRAGSPMASVLDHCVLDLGGGGASGTLEFLDHSNVVVSDCTVSGSETRGIYCNASSRPTIQNNNVTGSASEAVRIAAENVDALSGNTYTGNNPNAVAVYGDVTRSLTWPNEGVSYYPDASMTVYKSATLTLEPGARVGCDTNALLYVGRNTALDETDRGALIAIGTQVEPITFYRRATYDWGGIRFDGSGFAPLPSTLDYCVVDNGGGDLGSSALCFLSHSSVSVTNSTISNSEDRGVYCDESSAPTITGNLFQANAGYPLRIDIDNPPVLSNNTYVGNGKQSILLAGDVVKDATLQYDTLPYDRYNLGEIDIYGGATLTVDPGVTVMLDNNMRINVGWDPVGAISDRGALVAEGTPAMPIRIVRRATYKWGGINFDGRAGSPMHSSLRYCTLDCGGGNYEGALMFHEHSNASVYRCRITGSETRGIYCDATSRPSLAFNSVSNSSGEAVRIAAENADALDRNLYADNNPNAIAVYGDVTRDVTWPNEGVPYRADDAFTVSGGATLTLSPGVTLLLNNGDGVNIGINGANDPANSGAIQALGTPDLPIVFSRLTSYDIGAVRIEGRGYDVPLPSAFRHCCLLDGGKNTNAALEVYNNDDVTIELCTFTQATTAGIMVNACAPTIDSCITAFNTTYGIRGTNEAAPVITFTDSYGNPQGNWNSVTPGTGCISEDPLFVAARDTHLQAGSPCIGAGNPGLDVGDGTVADMGCYQYGAGITSPVGFFNGGWNWFSIPLVPAMVPEASAVLGFDATNILYRWDPDNKNTELYPDDFTLLEVKRGYILRLDAETSVTYPEVGYTTPQTIPVPFQGVSMIGLPGLTDTLLEDLRIRNRETDETRDAWDDKNDPAPLMNWNWVYWDSVSRQAKICALTGGDDDTMRAWYGYRVWTNVDDLELLVPEVGMRGDAAPPTVGTPTRLIPRIR